MASSLPVTGRAGGSSDAQTATTVCMDLPSEWVSVDLTNLARADAQIEALVAARLGCVPEMVEAGAVLRSQMGEQARSAARAGAWVLVFGQVDPSGPDGVVPSPVSMVGATAPGSMTGDALEDLISAVEDRFPQAVCDLLGDEDPKTGPTLRVVRTVNGEDPTGEGLSLVLVDYWIDLGLPDTLAVLSFTTPQVCLTEDLLVVIETVRSTVRAHRTSDQDGGDNRPVVARVSRSSSPQGGES